MEPESSLLHSQVPATCPYSKPDESSPCHPSHCLKIHFNIILQFMPGFSKLSLSLWFPHQNPVCISVLPICAIWPTHLILLDLITQKISGEDCRSLSSSLCSLLHPPVTSSHLCPNIISNTLNLCSSLNVGSKFHTHAKQKPKLKFCISESLYF